MEGQSRNPDRAASAGEYNSMHESLRAFNEGFVSQDAIDAFDSLQ